MICLKVDFSQNCISSPYWIALIFEKLICTQNEATSTQSRSRRECFDSDQPGITFAWQRAIIALRSKGECNGPIERERQTAGVFGG